MFDFVFSSLFQNCFLFALSILLAYTACGWLTIQYGNKYVTQSQNLV